LAVWGSLYIFLTAPLRLSEPRKGVGRIAPAIVGVVMGYAVISLTLLVVSSVLPDVDWLRRIHLAIQIVLAAATLIRHLAHEHCGYLWPAGCGAASAHATNHIHHIGRIERWQAET